MSNRSSEIEAPASEKSERRWISLEIVACSKVSFDSRGNAKMDDQGKQRERDTRELINKIVPIHGMCGRSMIPRRMHLSFQRVLLELLRSRLTTG